MVTVKCRTASSALVLTVLVSWASPAFAHTGEAFGPAMAWTGTYTSVTTGAPIAVDGPDPGTDVDLLVQPATAGLAAPAGATVVQALLYWSFVTTQIGADCAAPGDASVLFSAPGQAYVAVTADAAYCAGAGAASYDTWVMRADVTDAVVTPTGTYGIDGVSAGIANRATDHASFAVVLVVSDPTLPLARVDLWDGLLTALSETHVVTITGLDVADPAGSLTWYVAEGDVGGTGTEGVTVDGAPGAAGPLTLSDAINPAANPMQHTINVVSPARTDTVGVDLDRFDIGAAIATGDTSLDVALSAGTDKWWLGFLLLETSSATPPVPVPEWPTGALAAVGLACMAAVALVRRR